MSFIPDNRKIPTIDKFGYQLKTANLILSDRHNNYFLQPSELDKYLCNTIEQGVKSIDQLLENNEKFL